MSSKAAWRQKRVLRYTKNAAGNGSIGNYVTNLSSVRVKSSLECMSILALYGYRNASQVGDFSFSFSYVFCSPSNNMMISIYIGSVS